MKTENVLALQPETIAEYDKIPKGTIAEQAHRLGINTNEPLIAAMDALLHYAKAYKSAYGDRLADDGVLGQCWLDAAKGIRGLLNGNGAVAMERNISTDSKDNGAVESMFWTALQIAGYQEKDL